MLSVQTAITSIKWLAVSGFISYLLIACGGGDGAPTPKAWGTAILIETNNNGRAIRPQIAVDNDGNALAVWQQHDGTRYNIWANYYDADKGWGTATLIETNNSGDATLPQVAFDTNGNAFCVWEQFDGTYYDIWVNRFDATAGWGIAYKIENNNTNAGSPQIAFDAFGNAIAVWHQDDGSFYSIWANHYDVITGWGNAALIENSHTGHAGMPQIAVDANGDAFVVWEQNTSTSLQIWSNHFNLTTGWGTAVSIGNNNGMALTPKIKSDNMGNAFAIWDQYNGSRSDIWSNRYDAVTGWGTAVLIENNDSGGASISEIAVDTNSNALAIWMQDDGTRPNIWANYYDAATGWGSATLVETDNAGNAGLPQVAFDNTGIALAVWEQSDGSRLSIWANRYVPIAGWDTPTLVETNNTEDAFVPKLAVDPNGDAFAVWMQDDGARINIWANRYE